MEWLGEFACVRRGGLWPSFDGHYIPVFFIAFSKPYATYWCRLCLHKKKTPIILSNENCFHTFAHLASRKSTEASNYFAYRYKRTYICAVYCPLCVSTEVSSSRGCGWAAWLIPHRAATLRGESHTIFHRFWLCGFVTIRNIRAAELVCEQLIMMICTEHILNTN